MGLVKCTRLEALCNTMGLEPCEACAWSPTDSLPRIYTPHYFVLIFFAGGLGGHYLLCGLK